ncbi:MAG TPA: sigma-70 family RNA polymerase sigma factor, partial [Candidatus Ozemobacteraceae bacterium]|nr:sigma-70 family RNA polymerase sigma factor [Candidatus Ozemobacteraceae bacterium]
MAHSNTRRLNPSDEIIKQYFRELKRFPPMSRKEELQLLTRIRNGDVRARRRLVMANLRFVVAVAKKYKFINDVPFEDLIAVGNLGLMRAMKRFDVDHNVRFISYAVWWIRQAIIQTISLYSNAVRLPVSRVHQGLKIKKTEEQLSKRLNRKPTLNELAQECGMNPDDLRKFFTDTPVVVSMDGTRVENEDEDLMLSDAISDN